MSAKDLDYFAKRERQERENAVRTQDTTARRVHLELADRYAARLREVDVIGTAAHA